MRFYESPKKSLHLTGAAILIRAVDSLACGPGT
jgi:hypothetical protein